MRITSIIPSFSIARCRTRLAYPRRAQPCQVKHYIPAMAEIPWRLAPLDDPGLPEFIAQRALPDAASARCELCDRRPRQPMSTVLIVDGPHGLPVPFLICAECRRTL